MGLKLTYTLPNEVSGDHWSIAEYWVNSKELKSYILIYLYKDSAAKDAGKPHILYKRFDWSGVEFPFDEATLKSNGVSEKTIAYAKIKATAMSLDENGNPIGDIDWSQAVDAD
jgi:hypothetical protein